jgi:acyl-[acyl-carrier-protein]-phospholipid O-acyltransferase/long-chain-fatty-acid--[acyl-carrier-protein] ligase
MSQYPNNFPDTNDTKAWFDYVDTLPSIGEHWVQTSKRPGNPVILKDTLGTNLTAKTALVGSIILSRRIANESPEQNIGILLPTTAGSLVAGMAVVLLGKTLVPLNYTAPIETMVSAIEQANLQTVYTSTRFLENLKKRGINLDPLANKVRLVMLEDLRAGVGTFEKISTLLQCKFMSSDWLQNRYCGKPDLHHTAVILFSSGSEGAPKGVMLSHHNLLANVKQLSKILDAKDDDLIMANLPIFHSFGLTACMFLAMLERIKVVCHTDPTDVVTIAKAIREHRATLLFGTSSFFRLYIKNRKVKAEDMQSLRLTVAGAEKLQSEISASFKKRFGKVIHEGYGCTETSPVSNVNTPFPNLESPHLKDNNKPGTVGKPLPGTQIRIADPDTLHELPLGTAGMILIAGPQVMQGYLNNEELTSKVVVQQDGMRWYVSGDKGSLDEDGFLTIEDRYARFAKISGEMIGLGTVEQALRNVLNSELTSESEDLDEPTEEAEPGLADTEHEPEVPAEIMAINIPDPKKGEIIVILSTQELLERELRPRLLEAGLNNLSLPSAYITVESLPKLGSGKADFATAKEIAKQAIFNKD